MNWDRIFIELTGILTEDRVRNEHGAAFAAGGQVVEIEPLLERAAESEDDREHLEEDGWFVVEEHAPVRQLLSFDYLSSPAGGSVVLFLLDSDAHGRYLLLQPDEEPVLVAARIEGDVESVLGPLVEDLLGANGEGYTDEIITMLPDLVHNRAPDVLPEAHVRAGCRRFMDYAEKHYGGWEYLSPAYPNPQTAEEKEAAFADYWERRYSEAENPYSAD